MELQLDNSEYQVVFKDSNLEVTIEESIPLNVIIGESARMEVNKAITYVQSGAQEIKEAVQEGIASFDSNAQGKTSEFNTNVNNRLSEYNSNADNKFEAYNNNAYAKLCTYNDNASEKNSAFDSNYTEKKNLIDAQADIAKQWAIGEPIEPAGNSAKYWAGQAQAELSGLTSRVSTIEGKIPNSASTSNQLADKSYVISQMNNKQDTLISAANIKTINNQSLLGSGNITIQPSPDLDNKSITKNTSQELQTVGVIDSNNTTNAIKTWTGTKAQYNAIASKDPNTLYNITDDTDISLTILEVLYPVGSVYITTASGCPLSALISGSTWELVSSGRVLQGADNDHAAGTTIEAGLPNITGNKWNSECVWPTAQGGGAIVLGANNLSSPDRAVPTRGTATGYAYYSFDASQSNSIYGNSTTVQPPAYVVNIYRRTA